MSISPAQNESLRINLARVAFYMSIVVAVTSLIDLFINRLLFRAGPDVLGHITLSGVFYFALVGRISITLEQILLFVIFGVYSYLLLNENQLLPRLLGGLLVVVTICSLLLYGPLSLEMDWAVSMMLVMVVAFVILGLGCLGIIGEGGLSTKQRFAHAIFLVCVVLSFMFGLYYRTYLLAGAAGVLPLPLPLGAYLAGVYMVMASMIAAFAYALGVPSPRFAFRYQNLAKAAVLPTILVAPIFYEMIRNFFMTQILVLVVAMSTDFVLSHTLLQALILLSWFYLTAIMVLFLKGHFSAKKLLFREAVGLVLIMSTTYLFNYPYYLMLGTAGMLLLSYPHLGATTPNSLSTNPIKRR